MTRRLRLFETYQCPRLGGPATVELERYDDEHYPDPANRPEVFEWREVMKSMVDCRDKVRCGVREVTASGWKDHWIAARG